MNQPAREQLQIAQAARSIALQMLEERGRGAVLVGVARVDAALESLLQAALVPAAGATDTFFQPDRPLGSFGARITLAAGLGLIEPAVEQALQPFETGHEHIMTGGWARVLMNAEQRQRDRAGMERAEADGLVQQQGIHRGVLLVEFLDRDWGEHAPQG